MKKSITKNKNAGIYIHIPFCLSKCDYCDFVSFAGSEWREKYISALCIDIAQKAGKFAVGEIDTIYFGGGTPSILKSHQIAEILACVKENFTVSPNAEITIEVNPKTADKEKLLDFKNIGINRVSVGVQSFENSELTAVSRAHTGEEAKEILQIASEIFDNFSCDLMLGLPNSTMASVFKNIKTALAFSPKHISLYGLQVEEGTKLFENVANGLILPREDTVADMFELSENMLKENGFSHYEISNFAKDGFESKHNLGYWKLKDYIGFGVSAHSLVGLDRFYAPNTIEEYITAVIANTCELPEETLTPEEAKKEYIMLGFRLQEGVDLIEYNKMLGGNFQQEYKSQLEKFAPYLEITPTSAKIQPQYYYISNQIISEFM
ncbi:MAG: radical SAM family heme chaperone HemW [Bacillota bacterium]